MTLTEGTLAASVVFAGMWAGLTAMLTMVIHPMLRTMDGRDFAKFLRAFLPTARRAPFNYAAIAGMLAMPIVALIALRQDPGSASFILTAIGLALTVTGPFLVSNRLSEPHYDVMLAWDPDAMPDGWQALRARYFALNWIRFLATCAALGCFLAALLSVRS